MSNAEEERNPAMQTKRGDPDFPNLQFPPESIVAERTFNIMQGFIIVDSLWMVAAVALSSDEYFLAN